MDIVRRREDQQQGVEAPERVVERLRWANGSFV